MSDIITFPGRASKPNRNSHVDLEEYQPRRTARRRGRDRKEPTYRQSGLNMRTAAFRNREAIVEATEEDLVRDVRLEMGKAQTKLKRLQQRLKILKAELEFLNAADTKLSAAIVEALLSGDR